MTRTVAVIDYGMGNLRSVSQAVAHVARSADDVKVIVTGNPEDVFAAERIVLPGQGAMRDCMRELADSGLQGAVLDALRTKPVMVSKTTWPFSLPMTIVCASRVAADESLSSVAAGAVIVSAMFPDMNVSRARRSLSRSAS